MSSNSVFPVFIKKGEIWTHTHTVRMPHEDEGRSEGIQQKPRHATGDQQTSRSQQRGLEQSPLTA